MLDNTLAKIRKIIPAKTFRFFQPAYHWALAFMAAVWYRFPSRKLKVIGVTGTKGKSSTVEILNAILEEAGYKTALSNTIRFKVGEMSSENLYKMSMPGRFAAQRLLRKAVNLKCDYFIIEMTSQGSILYRHRFIDLDALIFTNLAPEHIESHGSYDNYVAAKVEIAKRLSNSHKPDKAIIANADDKESPKFLECNAERKITYSAKDAEPYEVKRDGIDFTLSQKTVHSQLSGLFNLYNIMAAISAARSQNVSDEITIRAVEKFSGIPGRVQKIELPMSRLGRNQDFTVIVDYAHTPDSLEKLYQVFQSSRNICVLGGTGGGRDSWKRKEMGRIADKYCDEIILTDEDPYDEDPKRIVGDVATGIVSQKPEIIMDRRLAIREAIKRARTGDSVLITGKGTDPYIMGPNGTKTPWSDADVAREELEVNRRD
ncbi:UDP-N-acetylmuramoyl-L-alanyl-D-glutamate--2,6-diaminopimelate ligase [Patescibacteria group bacterium]|nr:UDP-N-acetylmuramoyl-L-alanyl-D-glutamate--2,6-diaminopimelate ligase [Patescibacteria group bacterium]MDE1946611.1 UDP-N-acetylmuramoyl-L-alanyl-D-glutamate--2,6-diaminopimelate ligase [Patescibacteria group bacterium]MDE2010565.1 UDP-N-acetylmuramoyl-L-alanyl-D-glutamate--2,6-diaminopimelate ligase [Patescibacteria group bacterium]MDE2233153.1 UDP-N-acetylmuramoyl-L-alanyl-D-glutamate--2,6-diaminopimelate ligase [Patescibacteria group bacterium]